MTEDIVERAREWADGAASAGIKGDAREMALANAFTEMADEIERLRAAEKRVLAATDWQAESAMWSADGCTESQGMAVVRWMRCLVNGEEFDRG